MAEIVFQYYTPSELINITTCEAHIKPLINITPCKAHVNLLFSCNGASVGINRYSTGWEEVEYGNISGV